MDQVCKLPRLIDYQKLTSCARIGRNILAEEVLLVNSVNRVMTAPQMKTRPTLGTDSRAPS